MSRPEPVRSLSRYLPAFLPVLVVLSALVASGCDSSNGGDPETDGPCQLTVQNATGFDFTAVSVAGTNLAASAIATDDTYDLDSLLARLN